MGKKAYYILLLGLLFFIGGALTGCFNSKTIKTDYGIFKLQKIFIEDSTLNLKSQSVLSLDILNFYIQTKGLTKKLTIEEEKSVQDSISKEFQKFLKNNFKCIKSNQREIILGENYKNFYNIIITRRSKLEDNFSLSDKDKEILKEFYKKYKVRYIILPIEITIKRNQIDQIGDKKIFVIEESLYIQIWDMKKGDLVFENISNIRFKNTYTDKKSEFYDITKKVFPTLVKNIFSSINIK